MDQKIIDFLTHERMAVLGIVLPDGSVHTAAMHFVDQEGTFYFSTHDASRKVQGLTKAAASMTVGFSEETWVTMQMDGTIEKTDDQKTLILSKYPDMEKRLDEHSIYLKFIPTWYRYSDFKNNIITEG